MRFFKLFLATPYCRENVNVEEEEVGVTGGSFEALLSVLRKGIFLQTLTEEWL
jgi:hypothetical protein